MAIQAHTQIFLKEWLSKQGLSAQTQINLLLGDGSTRRFYRVLDFDSKKSYILLSDPEWKQSRDYGPHQLALSQAKIAVPQFWQVDESNGVILMEDLGDELLQHRISLVPQETEKWLLKAVELLAHLHGKLFPVPKELPVAGRSFDETKYFEEISFTLEHLRKGYLGLPALGSQQLQSLRAFCSQLGSLSPQVFCHRDYHCRNLLVHRDQLFMIDFQDARLGSPAYDLASLLFDAYTPISESTREKLFLQYQQSLAPYTLSRAIDFEKLKEDLWKVAYQRTLKAAGSFASFWTRFGKETHLVYIEPALKLSLLIEKTIPIPESVRSAMEVDKMLEALYAKKSHT